MSYYLLDNPPASPRFYPSRSNTPTWAVGVHTSEGPTGPGCARNLAAFIQFAASPNNTAVNDNGAAATPRFLIIEDIGPSGAPV